MDNAPEFPANFDGLVALVDRLRGGGGCPWDREQTAESMKRYFLDECYELIDAIDEADPTKLAEELGDVLFNVAFQLRLATEAGSLSEEQPFAFAIEKFVRRHPHVFGEAEVADAGQAWTSWDAIKRGEQAGQDDSILDSVARSLPALSQAQLLQERAARVGFDLEDLQGVVDKVGEELAELERAETPDEREAELGDVLFSLVNLSRWHNSDAETALRAADVRFRQRFAQMEILGRERGVDLKSLTLDEKEALWQEAKEMLA